MALACLRELGARAAVLGLDLLTSEVLGRRSLDLDLQVLVELGHMVDCVRVEHSPGDPGLRDPVDLSLLPDDDLVRSRVVGQDLPSDVRDEVRGVHEAT